MIRRLQALNYRCLRYVDVPLDRFRVLVGPNASGKSTLFDALDFLGDLMRDGLEFAVNWRSSNFQDLVWNRPKDNLRFELAVEFDVPDHIRTQLPAARNFRIFRYEVAVGAGHEGPRIESERGVLLSPRHSERTRPNTRQKRLFPDPPPPLTPSLPKEATRRPDDTEQVPRGPRQLHCRDDRQTRKRVGDQHFVRFATIHPGKPS